MVPGQEATVKYMKFHQKFNKNLFVVQLDGQSSRLSGEAVNYPTLEKSKHCLGAVLGKLFQLVQLCGQLDSTTSRNTWRDL